MFDQFVEWLGGVVGAPWRIADGGYPEGSTELKKSHMCVVRGMGGMAPDVDDRRPVYKVILMGPIGSRPSVSDVRAAAEKLMQACQGDVAPCGAALVRAMGEPVGPSYTSEDRAWMSVDLQVVY